jgi:DNA-binding MarR family transcriptional regulator
VEVNDRMARAPQVDALDVIEIEMAVLARSLELLRRRGRIHREMDRAGYLLLRTLEETGPLPVTQLADRVGLDASTVTRQVAALEADGFTERRADPADRRCAIVVPSAHGRRLMREVQRRRRERFEELLAGWSDEDRAHLARLLARLNRSVTLPEAEADPDLAHVDARRTSE